MSKFKVDSNVANGQTDAIPPSDKAAASEELPAAKVVQNGQNGSGNKDEMLSSVVTIGVVGVGAALIEVALIPGIVIGIAAAFAPKYVPQIGNTLRPLFKSTVSGAYKFGRKAREAVAETKERVQDLVAEVNAEHTESKMVPTAAVAAPDAAATVNA